MSHKKDARLIWVKKVESEKDLGVIFGSKINFIGGGGSLALTVFSRKPFSLLRHSSLI